MTKGKFIVSNASQEEAKLKQAEFKMSLTDGRQGANKKTNSLT